MGIPVSLSKTCKRDTDPDCTSQDVLLNALTNTNTRESIITGYYFVHSTNFIMADCHHAIFFFSKTCPLLYKTFLIIKVAHLKVNRQIFWHRSLRLPPTPKQRPFLRYITSSSVKLLTLLRDKHYQASSSHRHTARQPPAWPACRCSFSWWRLPC